MLINLARTCRRQQEEQSEYTEQREEAVKVGEKVVGKKTVRLAVKRQARTFVNPGNGGVDNNSRHVPAINSGASETCTVVGAAAESVRGNLWEGKAYLADYATYT